MESFRAWAQEHEISLRLMADQDLLSPLQKELVALAGIDLEDKPGDFVVIRGTGEKLEIIKADIVPRG